MRLVGVLVSVAILGVLLMVWLYYGTSGTGGSSSQLPSAPPPASRVSEVRQAAESVECRNNLSQIRAAIQMRITTEDTYPASLQELQLPASMLVCPVSGQPYQYDPNTGQVRCLTAGHMSY
ncbi:MAG: type II secretion system protein [Fimbriimonadales bacterium]